MIATAATVHRTDVTVGGTTVALRTTSREFAHLLERRYAGFLGGDRPAIELEVEVSAAPPRPAQADLRVRRDGRLWCLERGDFSAQWDPRSGAGRVRQTANPYSIDTVLRILHTLALAPEGGFLLHAASAVRGGRAYAFTGVSGAGKTTLSRLAPEDVTPLSDEISYVRREGERYFAYGTPFSGELGKSGANIRAPLEAILLLEQAPENRIVPVDPAQAARGLLAGVLFFAEDEPLVRAVFRAALDLAERVPVRRMRFTPDSRAWELIGATGKAA